MSADEVGTWRERHDVRRTENDMERLTVDFTMQEIEALLKTVGIAINNLLTKTGKVGGVGTQMGRHANDEMQVLVGIQQELLALIAECSVTP